jgi:CysZ protein
VALATFVVVAVMGATIFVGAAVVIFLGSILSAPFYDAIAQQVTRKLGGVVVDHDWWGHLWPSVKHAAAKLWWYLLVQAGLIILYVVPGVFGPVAFVTIGYVATVFFLALDFLDFSFDFQGWTFAERRRWCLERKGLVLGFGSAVFLGLGVPLVNLFVPPVAVAGSVLLFMETYASPDSHGPR